VARDGHSVPFDFRIDLRDGVLRQVVQDGPYASSRSGIRYRETDCVVNFALMRRELFDHVLWDSELKLIEHLDFYLRIRDSPFAVLHTPDVAVDHPPVVESAEDYAAFRARWEFVVQTMIKHGLRRVETIAGLVVELGPDGLTVTS
jgi:hypothetical protein